MGICAVNRLILRFVLLKVSVPRHAREKLDDAGRMEGRREDRLSFSLAAAQNAEARP